MKIKTCIFVQCILLTVRQGVETFTDSPLNASFLIHIEVLPTHGFRAFLSPFTLPMNTNIHFFGFHSNINAPIRIPEIGHYEGVVTNADLNGYWIYEEKSVKLNIGDVINYWAYIEVDKSAFKLDLRSYMVEVKGLFGNIFDKPKHKNNFIFFSCIH